MNEKDVIWVEPKEECKEIEALRFLRDAWVSTYRAKELLGKEHAEYKALEKLCNKLNFAAVNFHKYTEKDSPDVHSIQGIKQ